LEQLPIGIKNEMGKYGKSGAKQAKRDEFWKKFPRFDSVYTWSKGLVFCQILE
jgi:hypothetical protein